MKKKIFDFRLYLQGLGRLRVIGIALAILCITVSMLVPITRWLEGPKLAIQDKFYLDGDELVLQGNPYSDRQFLEELGCEVEYASKIVKEDISDRLLIIPVTVASYLSPVLMLIMFAFLNKRKESDFYHAIPFTRGCVYTSFVAAVLTWVWGVLIVSGLLAGLIWALCPYVSFSFGGLICQILISCLNAALLAAFTSVAVSLTGTIATSIVTTLLVMCSWRTVLGIGLLCLEDVPYNIIDPEYLWGGYLNPSFLLPVSLITSEVTPAVVVIYAAMVTLALFALGGWLYVKRNSELAGRSVPGRAVHILLRGLMTLPVALLLTYQFFGGDDFTTVLIMFVCMLLVFYLYELLTTKSARSMFRATPWLGAVLGVCLLFAGAVLLTEYVERHERTDADRIQSVEIMNTGGVVSDDVAINRYEMSQIGETDDARIIDYVADAWTQTQKHPGRMGREVHVRIKLKSGRTVVRNLKFLGEDYYSMMGDLQKDLNTKPVPTDEAVSDFYIYQRSGESIRVSGKWRARILEAMRQDYAAMTLEEKKNAIASYITSYDSVLRFVITADMNGETATYQYYLCDGMTHTFSLMYELFGLPSYGRVAAAERAINDWTIEKSAVVQFLHENGDCKSVDLHEIGTQRLSWLKSLLRTAVGRAENESAKGDYIFIYLHVDDTYSNGWDYVTFPAKITQEEYEELLMHLPFVSP